MAERERRGRRRGALAAGLLAALLAAGALCCLGSSAGRILPGVSLAGVELGGLTASEAEALLEQRLAEPCGEIQVLLCQEGALVASLRCRELGASPDFAGGAAAALAIGSQGGLRSAIVRGWLRLLGRYRAEAALEFSLDQDQLRAALPPEPVNAAYDPATGEVREGRLGVVLEPAALAAALRGSRPGAVVEVEVRVVRPEIGAEQLRRALFRDVLGTCTTQVGGSAVRRRNVALSAQAIDGLVLLPGAVFDYNAAVGERTEAKGYGPAPAYVNGETVSDVGGGVCQTSSTLYLAALLSDLEILERTAHRYASSYIPLGLDATVSWGGPEFRFRNDTPYPLRLKAEMEGEQLTVTVVGTRLGRFHVEMRSDVLSTDPYVTRYEDSAALPPGAEQVRQSGYTGCTVQTYREVYDDEGNLVSRSAEARSVYRRRDKIVLRGAAPPPEEEKREEAADLLAEAPF